jgi:Zn-dependent protease
MTTETVKFALYMLVALVPSFLLHEWAHAAVAERLGDLTPRRFGRRTLKLRPHVDRFGSVVLPVLLTLMAAVGYGVVPFAYGKPMPHNPAALRRPGRDVTLIALAGPGMNLILAAVAGVAVRAVTCGETARFLIAVLAVNAFMAVFMLLPIPGLDGSRIMARFLQGRAREVYVGMDEYLPLFALLVFFLLGPFVLGIVGAFTDALFRLFAGSGCRSPF